MLSGRVQRGSSRRITSRSSTGSPKRPTISGGASTETSSVTCSSTISWTTSMNAVAWWAVTPNDRTRWLMTFVGSSTACPSPQKTC